LVILQISLASLMMDIINILVSMQEQLYYIL
jgi:hypothetical protein